MKYPVLIFNDGNKFIARCLMVDSIQAAGTDLSSVIRDIESQLRLRVCDEEAEIVILVDRKGDSDFPAREV